MSHQQTRYVVLFRGVGGATQLPVKQLRTVLDDAGFSMVKTYINSGNAVLSSNLTGREVADKVTALVGDRMGFEKSVLVASAAEWAELIAQNPYPEATGEPTKLHAALMERVQDADKITALAQKATGTERFDIRGRVLYLHTPDGMGRSRFAPKIQPTLKLSMTARNWRSVLALGKMAGLS